MIIIHYRYPSWPRLRTRPWYSMDKRNDKDSVNCRKKDTKMSARKLTYGIFSLLCQHHVCYGFHIMQTPEGRNDLFCVLYERYPVEYLI